MKYKVFVGYDEDMDPVYGEPGMDYEELETKVWWLEHKLKNIITMVDNGHNTADIKSYIKGAKRKATSKTEHTEEQNTVIKKVNKKVKI